MKTDRPIGFYWIRQSFSRRFPLHDRQSPGVAEACPWEVAFFGPDPRKIAPDQTDISWWTVGDDISPQEDPFQIGARVKPPSNPECPACCLFVRHTAEEDAKYHPLTRGLAVTVKEEAPEAKPPHPEPK